MSNTITSIFVQARDRQTSSIALKYRRNRKWHNINWAQYFDQTASIACALFNLGVEPGDRVAIFSDTRKEWAEADMAILGLRGVTIPVYSSNHPKDVAYILNNSEAKIVICETKQHVERVLSIREDCPKLERIISIEDTESEQALNWSALQDHNKKNFDKFRDKFVTLCHESRPEDIASILYTSGTTGEPKGVVLTHRQIISEVADVFHNLNCTEQDLTVSFLPYAHIFGRIEHWGSIYAGYTLAMAESIERLSSNLRDIQPTIMIGVPRIYEKIHEGILSQVGAHPNKKKIFDWALKVGSQYSQVLRRNETPSLLLVSQYGLAKKLVFNKIYQKLGGRLRFAASGGAPLNAEIAEFFHAMGILIIEGYGLTETTGAVSLSTQLEYEFGTVGKPFGDVQIKIADDGEILVKSDKVMKEYYKNPEATAEVMENGFFKTGDIGEFTETGFLKITDRKKDLIKTAGGKYVAPQKLENLMKMSRYISQVHIHGDRKKYIVALITLAADNIKTWAADQKIAYTDISDLSQNEKLRDLIREEVANINEKLPSFEAVKNFAVLKKDFTVEGGELTPSLKIKRKHLDQVYEALLNSLY